MRTTLFDGFSDSIEPSQEGLLPSALSLAFDGISSSIIEKALSFGIKSVVAMACKEMKDRRLTSCQLTKIEIVLHQAYKAFMDLLESDKENYSVSINESYNEENAYHTIEKLFLTAAEESQTKKLHILGNFLGREFYLQEYSWEDIFSMINEFRKYSYRQLIMIKILFEKCPSKRGENNTCVIQINNPAAEMEFQQLLIDGLYDAGDKSIGWGSVNLYGYDFTSDIVSSEYSKVIYEKFQLKLIPEKDVQDIVKTF